VKQALLWRAAAGRFSVDPATIGHLKSESRADTGSGLLSAPDVRSLISDVVEPRRSTKSTKSRRYSARYKVMLNWKAVVGVAQLVERRSVAPNVAGSNPVSHPKPFQFKTKPFAILPSSLNQNLSHTYYTIAFATPRSPHFPGINARCASVFQALGNLPDCPGRTTGKTRSFALSCVDLSVVLRPSRHHRSRTSLSLVETG
jgi:hypothetical protein